MATASKEDTDVYSAVRNTARTTPLINLLQQPANTLLGVNIAADSALKKLAIASIFDLASSVVFDSAVKVVAASTDPQSPLYRYGKVPSDLVRTSLLGGTPLQKLLDQPISLLAGIPQADATSIGQALDASTIRDFAMFPPYLAALRIMKLVYFPQTDTAFDPDYPSDLVPKTGQYPVEKVQYSTLHMGEIQTDTQLVDVSGPNFSPPSLATLAAAEAGGFKTVATGALLTFSQSWFAQGITLGHLLHSCTLAPGESTRIAVVDWSRKERGNQVEGISEQDDLVNDSDHTRSIAEVTKGVATEAQQGFSGSTTIASTNNSATSTSGDISGGVIGAFLGGPSFTEGSSNSQSNSAARSDAYSSTFGNRQVSTQTMQNINDRTHQYAHDSRNRRASVVKEISQSEHENVSTRVIANYNHSHALSVNYYEVVQVFRVEVRLAKAEQVIFVPVALPDFNDDTIIRRFHYALARAAFDASIRESLVKMDTIELQPEPRTSFSIFKQPLDNFFKEALSIRSSLTAGAPLLSAAKTIEPAKPATGATGGSTTETPATAAASAPPTGSGGGTITTAQPETATITPSDVARPARIAVTGVALSTGLPVLMQTNKYLWDQEHLSRLSHLFQMPLLRQTSTAIPLPADVNIEGAIVEGTTPIPLKAVFITATGQKITNFGPGQAIPLISLRDLVSIGISGSHPDLDYQNVTVTLTLNRGGVITPMKLPSVMILKQTAQTVVVNVRPGSVGADIKSHLMSNRMYYAQAVYRSLDATDLALMLSNYGYKVGGKVVPIGQVINPKPVRYVGNYMAFTTNIQSRKKVKPDDPEDLDPTWTSFLADHAITVGDTQNEVVPLGTGGVFAEAVLGRANCAERLDVTRFWNWQESPIPLQPTEIAAIQTGSRATQENLTPGQLSNPIISQQAPSSLPDPVGTAALLTAIQNGNIFRDQSGLAATIGLTQAALQATQQGAATAGSQASQNLQAQLQATTERQKTAANMVTDLAKTAASVYTGGLSGALGGGSGGGGGQSSKKGEMINYFDKTKGGSSGTGAPNPSATGGSGSQVTDGTSGGTPTPGSSGVAGGSGGAASQSALGFSQNPAARAAVGGETGMLDTLVSKVGDVIGIGGTGGESTAGALLSRKAWPKLDPDAVLSRIKLLGANPYEFNQGQAGLGLCSPAAFYYVILRTHPVDFVSFANALYSGGIGFLGDLKVAPGADLRNADYGAIMARLASTKTPPPQAEWMLMCAVRDSENWFLDYEGSPDETQASTTAVKEMRGWFDRTGWFATEYKDAPSVADLKALPIAAPDVLVILTIKTQLLEANYPWTKGDSEAHAIVVSSPIAVDEAADKVSFTLWTWATPEQEIVMKVQTLKDNVVDCLVVKKK